MAAVFRAKHRILIKVEKYFAMQISYVWVAALLGDASLVSGDSPLWAWVWFSRSVAAMVIKLRGFGRRIS